VQPLPRDSMKYLTITPPCGGTAKGRAHVLSEPGSLNPVSWQIVTPAAGLCSVRLLLGTDFAPEHTLVPSDNSTDDMGWFPCGDAAGLFTKDFQFPEGLTCDSCTLQWVWQNKVATYYQCVDLEITVGVDSACYGKCKNGGFCSEGLCLCPGDWRGTFCELDNSTSDVHILGLFVTFMLLSLIVGLLVFLIYSRVRGKPSQTEKLFASRYLGSCLGAQD
jgi:hypothetical protein